MSKHQPEGGRRSPRGLSPTGAAAALAALAACGAPADTESSASPATRILPKAPSLEPMTMFVENPRLEAKLVLGLNGGASAAERRQSIRDGRAALSAPTKAKDDSGWSYQLATADELAVARSTAHALDGAPDQLVSGDTPEWLVRYACCDDLPLFLDPEVPFLASGVVPRGTLLRVHDVLPGAGLKGKLAPASGDTLLLDLLDPRDALYFAEVEAPGLGISGYVPLYALLLSPLENRVDELQLDASYGKFARLANALWSDQFSPAGCGEGPVKNEVPTSPGDCFLVDEEWGWGQTEYEQTCDDVGPLYQGMKQKAEAGDDDCTSVFIGDDVGDPDDWTTDCGVVFDLMFVEYPEPLLVPNLKDYECGEYRFGATHYAGIPELHQKKLVGFPLWNRHVEVFAGRLAEQLSSSYTVKSLTHFGATKAMSANSLVDAKDLWFGFDVIEPTLDDPAGYVEFKACAFMPGVTFWSPEVHFEADDTPGHAVERLEIGSATVGQVQGCVEGELHLGAGWQPEVVWTGLSDWQIERLSLKDIQITYAPWVYATAVAATVVLPALMPVLGAVVVAVLDTALAASAILPELVNALDEGVFANAAMAAFTETFLVAYPLKWMQDVTDQMVNGAMPRLQPVAQATCAAVCPASFPAGHPLRPFCTGCSAFANGAAPFQLVKDPGAEAKGCYDERSLFTPDGKTAPSTSPWWYDYAGYGWASGDYTKDKGCKLSTRFEATLEKRSWELAKCALWRANAIVNQDLPLTANSVRGDLTAHCAEVGREMLRLYYGTGEDLKAMIEAKHPDHLTTLKLDDAVEPEVVFGLTDGVEVIVEPATLQLRAE